MTSMVPEDAWRPVGVDTLEPLAEQAVRSARNVLVVAGPGAGKTELLAQRADFLLRTGRCAHPRRILAISFKRDAAKNLDDRVRRRTPELAARFDSLTLDAFAKSVVDRFLPALPVEWRPHAGYQVRTGSIGADEAKGWLDGAVVPAGHKRPNVRSWDRDKVLRGINKVMHGIELPYDQAGLHPTLKEWGLQWWREQLAVSPGKPSLTFPMLNRLAAFLLRTNPMLQTALRQTYAAVFLDEFQDTTAPQWDLVRASFMGSQASLTAVGDSKQRIMVWAGAKKDIFGEFIRDFAAVRKDLTRNYRSVADLVRIQHVIAEAVEAGSAKAASASANTSSGACHLAEFSTPEQEAACLADLIKREIDDGKSTPRSYCIIVRQQAAKMVEKLQAALQARGIVLRDESTLQDLLSEPVTEVVVCALQLASKTRDAVAWDRICDVLASLSGLDEERDGAELERLAEAHKACAHKAIARGDLSGLPEQIVDLMGHKRYRSTFRQYVGGTYLEDILRSLGTVLQQSLRSTGEGKKVADDLLGVDVVPAMTIHKSKGLEFETVVFLGLEDGQWWNFRSQSEEEKRAFFVAFSRAIRRVIFTYSDVRDTPWGRRQQAKRDVDALYDILKQAGVKTVDLRGYGKGS